MEQNGKLQPNGDASLRFARTLRSDGIMLRCFGLAVLLSALVAPVGSAQVVNFDDLPPGLGTPLPAGHGRANTIWNNVYYTNQVPQSPATLCRSQPNCGYNFGGNQVSVSSTTPFTFSGYIRQFALVSSPAATVLIEGTRGGDVVSSQVLTLVLGYQPFQITQTVDAVRFTPTSFTSNECGSVSPITACYFQFDDLTFGDIAPPTVVPEPASLALLGCGLGVLALMGRRRKT